MINKPFAESSEQNKDAILAILKQWLTHKDATVLEIGSGTGQHACYFSKILDHLLWQPTDTDENIQGIEAWRAESQQPNLLAPQTLDVTQTNWQIQSCDYIFSANTVHIMGWHEVELMFKGIRRILKPSGIFCLYGPFNYNQKYTSASNQSFDQWLKIRDPKSGIRDFEALVELGQHSSTTPQLKVIHDHEMPANNRILVFQSQATK